MTEKELKLKCENYYEWFKEQDYDFGINIYYLFYRLCEELRDILSTYENTKNNDIKIEDFKMLNFVDKIDVARNFFKNINLAVDVDTAINNGTIDYYEADLDIKNIKDFLRGKVSCDKNKNFDVYVPNSGFAIDLIVLLHELGHYANKPNNKKDVSILSETVALYTELQCYNYLSELDYKTEVEFFKDFRMNNIYDIVKRYFHIFPYFLTYITYNDLNKEKFEKLFKNKDYYEILNNIEYKDELDFSLLTMRYVFGIFLATYMYQKVKEDFSFTENINNFNKNLTNIGFYESLKKIGIETMDNDFIDILSLSMKNYLNINNFTKNI